MAEARAELLRMTDEQVDATTKRTLVENGRISSELARQSKAAEALVRESDDLRGSARQLRHELDLEQKLGYSELKLACKAS